MKPTYLYILLLLLCSIVTQAQVNANIELSRKSVYVQQPFRVTITVYTHTWFTAPLEFGNLQIPNAFIVPFDSSQPGMFTVGGKQYPGVQFFYIVFPYKEGNFSVPPIEITAQSPPEGSSSPKKNILHTGEQKFEVKDVPENLKKEDSWFVAKGVEIRESWTPELKNLKVGDVLKRTITIDAQGTLPQFIPDITGQQKVNWASTYPQQPILTDTRSESDVNGHSVQIVTYLLEKSGDFTIPPVTLAYWNPNTVKIFSKKSAETPIHVAENPNLGILTTLKDSLAAGQQTLPQQIEKKNSGLILGMRWYSFAACLMAVLFALYIFTRWTRHLIRISKKRQEKYRASEEYKFRQFLHAYNNSNSFLNALYAWWDKLICKKSASVAASLEAEKEEELKAALQKYYAGVYGSGSVENGEKIKELLKVYRKQKKQDGTKTLAITKEQQAWV